MSLGSRSRRQKKDSHEIRNQTAVARRRSDVSYGLEDDSGSVILPTFENSCGSGKVEPGCLLLIKTPPQLALLRRLRPITKPEKISFAEATRQGPGTAQDASAEIGRDDVCVGSRDCSDPRFRRTGPVPGGFPELGHPATLSPDCDLTRGKADFNDERFVQVISFSSLRM